MTEAEDANCQLGQGASGAVLSAAPWKLAAVALGGPRRGDPGKTALASQGGPMPPSLPRWSPQAKWILSLELLCKFYFHHCQMLPHA